MQRDALRNRNGVNAGKIQIVKRLLDPHPGVRFVGWTGKHRLRASVQVGQSEHLCLELVKLVGGVVASKLDRSRVLAAITAWQLHHISYSADEFGWKTWRLPARCFLSCFWAI